MKKNYFLKFLICLFSFTSIYAQEIDSNDKEILIKLYNALGGENWSNPWDLTANANEWYGISLDVDGKVESIILNYNNLTGVLPPEVSNLSALKTLAIGINKVSGPIPDLSNLPLDALHINANNFYFEDFEDQFDQLRTIRSFRYQSQQSPIGKELNLQVSLGERKTLLASSVSASNEYQWRKNGVAIEGATTESYLIADMNVSKEGIYDCIITNSKIVDLELIQNPIRLSISPNIIQNGSFENWFEFFDRDNVSKWYAGTSTNNSLTTITKVEETTQGQYALKMQTNRDDGNGGFFGRLVTDSNARFTLEEGKTYQISFDYKAANGTITELETRFVDGGLIEKENILTNVTNPEWQHHSYTFTPSRTSEFYDFAIVLRSNDQSSEIILDNLFVLDENLIRPNLISLDDYYSFSESSESYEPLVDPEASYNNQYFRIISIPFDFEYAGQKYSRFYLTIRPQISFTSTVSTSSPNFTFIKQDLIAPIMDFISSSSDSQVSLKTVGTTPNRTFIIEWKNLRWSDDLSLGKIDVQIHLEETTNNIYFHYGKLENPDPAATASIGMIAEFGEKQSFLSVTPGSPSIVDSETVNQSITPDLYPAKDTKFAFQYIGTTQCQKPTNLSSAYTSSSTEIKFSWNKAPFSDKQTLYVADESGTILSFVTTEDHLIVKGLESNKYYYAWVINHCSPQQSSVPSVKHRFSTPPPCRKPSRYTNRIVNKNSIYLQWDTTGNESQWDIIILDYAQNPNQADPSSIVTIDQMEYTFENLEDDTRYSIYYRANCGNGETSEWFGFWVTTDSDCPRPQDLFVENTSISSANLSWTPSGTETQWEMVIQEKGNGEPVNSGTLLSTPSYTVTNLDPNTLYEFYVRAKCSDTEWSKWAHKLITLELQKERDALMAFYNTNNGENWSYKENWNTDKPINTWYGIRMNEGQVTGIQLNRINITGPFPEMLSELEKLSDLNLGFNSLDGTIPNTIQNFKNLKRLFLKSNNLTGSIPEEIGLLNQLTSLNLAGNQFEGKLPINIGNLIYLESLCIESKNGGTLPESYKNLSKLVHLEIKSSDLTGDLSSVISGLTELQILDLSFNNFEGSLPIELFSLKNLISLNLRYNSFTGEIPLEIGGLSSLKELDLGNNQLEGIIPDVFDNFKEIYTLSFYNNKLTGPIPKSFGNIEFLERLDVSNNRLSGEIPENLISKAKNLETLYFNNNAFHFDALENFIALDPTIKYLSYNNQRLDVKPETVNQKTGNSIAFTCEIRGQNNEYQWYKDFTAITGANSRTLETNNLSLEDAGNYYCKVTNTIITDFALENNDITLNISILDDDADGIDDNVDICLYSAPGALVNEQGCEIISLPSDNFSISVTSETCSSSDNGVVNISSRNTDLMFTATITNFDTEEILKVLDFTKSVEIVNLASGAYTICFTLSEEASYGQCFKINVSEPQNLSVYPKVNTKNKELTLTLQGGTIYYVDWNGLQFSTTESEITLPLSANENSIKVFTDNQCQGVFEKTFTVSEKISVYPNPFQDKLSVTVTPKNNNLIEIYSMSGKLIFSESYLSKEGIYTINTSNLPIGTYFMNITSSTTTKNLKIVKK